MNFLKKCTYTGLMCYLLYYITLLYCRYHGVYDSRTLIYLKKYKVGEMSALAILTKCPLAKCPLAKCRLAKCPLAKCLDTLDTNTEHNMQSVG